MFRGKIGLLVFLIASNAYAGGSGVGNGGDVFSHYLEASRTALKQSLRQLAATPSDLGGLCGKEIDLGTAQIAECRGFITATLQEILKLNQVEPVPVFLLRDTPLMVDGPDGKPMEVDARTLPDGSGGIEISYERVKYYSPFQVLTLITHESAHKVLYDGAYVTDNPPTGSFATGRMLLDAVGIAIATYAQDQGIIGHSFRLLDHFSCQITSSAGGPGLGSNGFSERLFAGTRNFDKFQSGIGNEPSDLDVYAVEPGFSQIHFRIIAHEETGCHADDTANRWTTLSLVRVYPTNPDQEQKPDEVLNQLRIDSWDPVCEDPKTPKPMSLSYGTLTFTCAYDGSSGSSSSR